MSDAQPKPSKTLIVLSAIVIAGSLWSFCMFYATGHDNPFAWLANLFFLPMLLFLAIQQYRGTFRRAPSGARLAMAVFYGLSCLTVAGLITSVVGGLSDDCTLWAMRWLIFYMSLFAAVFVGLGRRNSNWLHTLRAAAARGELPASRWRFSLRELLTWTTIVAAMIGFTTWLIQTPRPPAFAEHVDRSSAPVYLPPGATDISYYAPYTSRGETVYEFSTSEQAFRDWVPSLGSIKSQSAGVPIREITTDFTIVRYTAMPGGSGNDRTVTIRDGLYYSWRDENQWNGIDAAFDRSTGRAYYASYTD